jgi:hypothetical protein
MMRHVIRWAVVLALIEGVVWAQPHERVALTALDLAADAPPYLRARVTMQIEEGLAATGYDVKSTPQLPDNLARCRSSDCMREVGRALAVQAILVAAITPRGESSVIALRLFDAETGRQLAELSEVCELCGESELIEQLGIATSAVRARAADARKPVRTTSSSVVPGVVVGGAGAVALGAGIYLAADGHGALGVAGISVGAAAIVLGAVLVVRAREHTLSVAPSLTGATVQMSLAW